MRGERLVSTAAKNLAIRAGELTYQGNPCKNGHDGIRYASNCRCVKCAVDDALKQNESRKAKRIAADVDRVARQKAIQQPDYSKLNSLWLSL